MRGAMVFALSFVRSHGLQRAALRAPTVRGFASRKAATSVAVEAFDATTATLPTNDDKDGQLLRLRHSGAHIMAMAVQRLFKDARPTIGPWIENGFYYDFDRGEGRQFSSDDLKSIKKEMDKIIKKNYPLSEEVVPRAEAARRIEASGERFKMEILDSIKDERITIWHIGEPGAEEHWWDLCGGPHVESTGKLNSKALALQSVAGAYWRGDENREMLTRIYATAWQEPWQLVEHKRRIEEAKKRDHRVLGKKLDLFSIQEAAGGGLVFWHARGAKCRTIMETFWRRQHELAGYEVLYTPHVANVELWKTSGHYEFYSEGMFDQMDVEKEQYQLKPMNCPFHCLVFKDAMRSYRELPMRFAELGTVYRYERSGTLNGLMRVRGFTQDDAHIFCTRPQLEDEILGVLDLMENVLSRFGFTEYDVMLSTRPEKSVGSDDIWEKATEALQGALVRKGWAYEVDEGGGAFYGPKIDLKIKDALGRKWQCSTVQCDFNLPQRFGLEYVESDGSRAQPIMVHRAIFGSLERFFAVLLESCGGELPLWLAPSQLRLLPVTDSAREFCAVVAQKALVMGVRCEVDSGKERLAKQIRNAEMQRVPVMAVVGDKEVASGELAVRARPGGDLGSVDAEELLKCLLGLDDVNDLGPFRRDEPVVAPAAVATEEKL